MSGHSMCVYRISSSKHMVSAPIITFLFFIEVLLKELKNVTAGNGVFFDMFELPFRHVRNSWYSKTKGEGRKKKGDEWIFLLQLSALMSSS